MKKILYVVDVQYDFMKGGALAVPDAEAIIPVINELIRSGKYDTVFFTKDFHPTNHTSFASEHGVPPFTEVDGEIKWPSHCIGSTKGAELNAEITVPAELTERVNVLLKGTNPFLEEYSGYSLKIQSSPEIGQFVQSWIRGSEIDVVGLAIDYCVCFTALDLVKQATVNVLLEGCRGVDPDSTVTAIAKMKEQGVNIID